MIYRLNYPKRQFGLLKNYPLIPRCDEVYIYVNSIDYNRSISDGPGIRTVVYLQGCILHCDGCHNKNTWDTNCGLKYDVRELAQELKEKNINKKITLSGGEPLFQKDAVIALIQELQDFDLCLYTGSNLDEVPLEILPYLHYIKVGRFKQELRCTTIPYIGSSNQKFIDLRKGE
jgi:anaerobic ribonucleoside-triphosphate reductase activating protein